MRPEHNLVLTGFMGTGKTSVGRELGARLDMEFADTDALIESRHGPITRIFDEGGEAEFRTIEREVAAELGAKQGLVIATGGRMILDPVNLRVLSRNGRIFCLVATPEEIHDRVTNDRDRRDRPLLEVEDPRLRINELLNEREGGYARFPRIATGHAGPKVIADEIAGLWAGLTTYEVDHPNGGYQVTVGAGILPLVRQLASVRGPLVVITDEGNQDLYAPILGEVDLIVVTPSGEPDRGNPEAVEAVSRRLREAEIDQTATVVSLGNSVIGEIAGSTAATYPGGLDLVHCPTDWRAMIDTSVGGKVGLDTPDDGDRHRHWKNPESVVVDVGTLQTLPERDFSSGLAEVVKHGLIGNGRILEDVESTTWDRRQTVLPGTLADLQSLVARAVSVKIAIVRADPFAEKGRRAVLGLGHEFAHGIEHASNGALGQGQALGMGLVAAARLSRMRGLVGTDLADRVEAIVAHIGLEPLLPGQVRATDVLDGMNRDVKSGGSPMRLVLLQDVESPFVAEDVTDTEVLEVLVGMQRGEGVEILETT